jgi:hypothetical protein
MKGRKLSASERRAKIETCAIERRKVFAELLSHLRAGYSLDCFGPLSEVSIRKYLLLYNKEFVQEDLDNAMRDAKAGWENIGRKQANGDCLGNSRSWYYNMSNRYGWRDKVDIEAEHKGQVQVNVVNYATSKALQEREDAQEA